MSTSHTHGIPSTENERALRFALALTGCFLIAEVIGGVLTGSFKHMKELFQSLK